VFPIKPDGTEGRWRWAEETYRKNEEQGIVEWVKTNQGWQVYAKQFAEGEAYRPYVTLWKCDEVGHNHSASEEVKYIFGTRVFDNPKPKELIEKIISTICDEGDIVLDAFAGSGTTGHAVFSMTEKKKVNFILVEMADYAETVTAERIKRVILGYKKKEVDVPGIERNFSFYELGPRLFDERGNINPEVELKKLKEYIWNSETKDVAGIQDDTGYLLGICNNTAYYFFYEEGHIVTFDAKHLSLITEKCDAYVVFADVCTISENDLARWNITFKKIPRDITKL